MISTGWDGSGEEPHRPGRGGGEGGTGSLLYLLGVKMAFDHSLGF